MKRTFLVLFFVVSTLIAIGRPHLGVAQTADASLPSTQQEIKSIQGELLQAILKSDTSIMEEFYAEDYVAIHGDGNMTAKRQEIDNFRSGVTKYDSITVREAKIRIYGDTAVVNALASVKALVNGKPYSGDVRNTRVWVRQGGHWKLVVFQTTRVMP